MIDQSFLNGLENYINPGVAKAGVPMMSWSGPYTLTTTYTYFNHGLVDSTGTSQTPDLVTLAMHSASANSLHSVFVDEGTLTSTQFKAGCDAGTSVVYAVAYKF